MPYTNLTGKGLRVTTQLKSVLFIAMTARENNVLRLSGVTIIRISMHLERSRLNRIGFRRSLSG